MQTVYLDPGVLLWRGICVKVHGRPNVCSCLSFSARMQISRQHAPCPQLSSRLPSTKGITRCGRCLGRSRGRQSTPFKSSSAVSFQTLAACAAVSPVQHATCIGLDFCSVRRFRARFEPALPAGQNKLVNVGHVITVLRIQTVGQDEQKKRNSEGANILVRAIRVSSLHARTEVTLQGSHELYSRTDIVREDCNDL